ncbi:PIN domain nuclease [Yinghuangia soli]|uniref:Ribonuclease VapC n=1 Tax=Yinghuangia soli TaxID=2908204 RepID=A0AA41PZ08_9ACTN|nr:PIN domain nuclease [Yinghuangia soli]MCF2528393.1 PIN domain nuclease [Yinghuangia soli]
MSFLADKSAFVRVGLPLVESVWDDWVDAGEIRLCQVTKAEILYSARSWADFEILEDTLEAGFPHARMPDDAWSSIADTQRQLARIGHHRGPGIADLLIAACARFHGLTVLHYDADFDTIAKVTGQPTQWLSPPGSL